MEKGQILPEKLVTWWDIAKGVGEVALEFLTKQIVHEPKPSESDHYRVPED